jgi:uncharacterized protein (UPF0332 family)
MEPTGIEQQLSEPGLPWLGRTGTSWKASELRALTAASGSTLEGMSPKDKRLLAREHLDAAQNAVMAERLNDAVNALFYAGEAAVVALADQNEIDTKRHHGLKADAATEMHTKGVLAEDYGPALRILNQARKDIWYEGEEPELNGGLEDLVVQVEGLVEAAEAGE